MIVSNILDVVCELEYYVLLIIWIILFYVFLLQNH